MWQTPPPLGCSEDEILATKWGDKILAYKRGDEINTSTWRDRILACKQGDKVTTYMREDKIMTNLWEDEIPAYKRRDKFQANQWEDKTLAYKREDESMTTRWEDKMVTNQREDLALPNTWGGQTDIPTSGGTRPRPSHLRKPHPSMLPRTMFPRTTSLLTRVTHQMMWTVTTHTLMRGVFPRLQRRGTLKNHWIENCPRKCLRQ
jgi:hypothetical protein